MQPRWAAHASSGGCALGTQGAGPEQCRVEAESLLLTGPPMRSVRVAVGTRWRIACPARTRATPCHQIDDEVITREVSAVGSARRNDAAATLNIQ